MSFIENIKAKAKSNLQRIVLPECTDLRTLKAADLILKENLAKLILLGDKEQIKKDAAKNNLNLDGAEIIEPTKSPLFAEFVELFVKLRSHKGMDTNKAKELLSEEPNLYFGAGLVKSGKADGMVAGAISATALVMRAALQILGTKKDCKLVSSFFVMCVPNCDLGENGSFIFSDCGLVQNPNAEELAAIAISSAESAASLLECEPRVALLSHSTKGSAKHEDVNKVIAAGELACKLAPQYAIDYELQADAALISSVRASKAPNSKIQGSANVLIFPDLDAGNIGYKIVQRLANAEAYGPITQGIAGAVNDLSRGCCAEDIVGVVAITAVQAQNNKN